MSQSRMGVFRLFLPVTLTVLLALTSCQLLEDDLESDNAPEDVNRISSLKPPQAVLETDQFLDEDEDISCRKNSEDCDSTSPESETPSALPEEKSSEDGGTAAAASAETESSEVESDMKKLNDGAESDPSSDTEDSLETGQQSSKLIMQAFGPLGADGEEETEGQSEEKEEEIWTEQTDDGAEQKRSGGRRFFSLMNLIKFLLNPVIEEFQEMEKSSAGQDAAATSDTNNQSSVTSTSAGNSSEVGDTEKKNATDSVKKTKFQCVGRNMTENTTALVRIVNSTVLLELLSFDKNHTTSDCVLVMFYAPWCQFCAATAPHYNAVARAFPQLEVLAVDTVHFSNLNARFGTVAVPNIMLFHQSRSAVRFNHTERHFHTLLQFITNTTGLEANSSVELSAEDYEGPLSSTPTEEIDYLLWFAWFFIVVCSGHIFISSQVGQHAIERVVVLWQEHQHQHIE